MDDRAVNAIDKLNDSVEELTEVIRAANHHPLEHAKHFRIVATPGEVSRPSNNNNNSSSSSGGGSSSSSSNSNSGGGSSSSNSGGGNTDGDVNNQGPIVVEERNTVTTRSVSVLSSASSASVPVTVPALALGQEVQGSEIKWGDDTKTTLGGKVGVAPGVALSVSAGGQGLDNSKDLSGS